MAKEEFGKAVLAVVADDKQLITTLKRDEQVVTQSVGKMQGSLNKLTVTTQGTGGAATAAAAGVSALGAAASASGSAAAQSAAQLGTLGVALSMTATAATAAKVQLLAAAAAAATFALTPIGAIITALALAAAAIGTVILKGRAERKEAEAWLKIKEQKLKDVLAATEKQAKAIEQQIRIEQGLAKATDFIGNKRVRELTEELNAIKARNVAEEATVKAQQARADKLGNLRDQLAVLRGTKTQYDLIADVEERSLRIMIDRTAEAQAAEKAARGEADARTKARAARFEGQGPKTAAEAQRLVMGTLKLVEANQRSAALTTAAFNKIAAQAERFGLTKKMLDKLAAAAGVQREAPGQMRFGAGAVSVAAFAATGRGAGVGTARDPVEQQRLTREEKRTKAAEATARNTERLADAFGRWNPGAA